MRLLLSLFLTTLVACCSNTPPTCWGLGSTDQACTSDSQCCTGYTCSQSFSDPGASKACLGLAGADCAVDSDCVSSTCTDTSCD